MERKKIRVNLLKNRPIINLLGEICWGFQVDDFEKRIGETKKIVEQLLERLLNEEKVGAVEVSLNASEIEILKRALKEVVNEIEDWEFHARIGATLEEVNKLPVFKGL